MKEIFKANTIEEAKLAACEKFGVSENSIVFRILEEPKKGLFGKVKREAQIEAIYELPEEEASAKPVENVPEPEKEVPPTVVSADSDLTEEIAPKAEKTTEDVETPAEEAPAYRPKRDYGTAGMESEPVEEYLTDETMPPNVRTAKQYILDIYKKMDIDLEITVMRVKSGVRMELSSDAKSGTIIGRRGETMDSVQYLASIVMNKNLNGTSDYCRLMLDSNGYREKRRHILEQLAAKVARSVLRSGRSNTLEPMNPYERRIIHSRVAAMDGVTSRSVGEDPYRRVVISPVGGYRRYNGNRRNSGYSNRNGSSNRGGYQNRDRDGSYSNRGDRKPYNRDRKPEDFKRSDMTSMKTSFERDYKKPKPEDEFGSDLYGKIEL